MKFILALIYNNNFKNQDKNYINKTTKTYDKRFKDI